MSGFPKGFPGADALAAAGVGHHAALRMTMTELTTAVGAEHAAKIIKAREISK